MAAFDGKAFGQEIVAAVRAHVEMTIAPILVRLEALEARQPVKGDPGRDGEPGARGEPGPPGRDAEVTHEMLVEAVKANVAAINEAVAAYLAENPPPAGKDGAPGRPGKDGADVVDAMIDRDCNLVLTLSDGRIKTLGRVVGQDGAPGRDGKDGAPGRDGKDGTDGVGFDDMGFEAREDGCYLVWEKGDVVKEARLPIPMDRGVWKEGTVYRAGDGVTWGGHYWFAQEETTEKPDSGKGWRMAVRRGRDGKDATTKHDKVKA